MRAVKCCWSTKLHIFLYRLPRITEYYKPGQLRHTVAGHRPILSCADFHFCCTAWSQSTNVTDGQTDVTFVASRDTHVACRAESVLCLFSSTVKGLRDHSHETRGSFRELLNSSFARNPSALTEFRIAEWLLLGRNFRIADSAVLSTCSPTTVKAAHSTSNVQPCIFRFS